MKNEVKTGKVICPSSVDPAEWPIIAVIVITKGRRRLAEAAVASIQACDYPPDRRSIIVVEETDRPEPIKGTRYEPIPVLNLGFGHARNIGVRLASAPLLAFTDDDCEVEADWLKELVRPLCADPGVDAVAGAVLVRNCGAIGRCENVLGFPGGGAPYRHMAAGRVEPWFTFSTCNCVVRKAAIERVGGFCEALRHGGEDDLLSKRIARHGGILFNPNARVYHLTRDSWAGVFRWFVRRGVSRVEMLGHAGHARKRAWDMIASSMLLRLALLIVPAALYWPAGAYFVLALVALHYLWIAWRHRWILREGFDARTLLLTPGVRFVMDVGMDVGILAGLKEGQWKRGGDSNQ